MTPVDRVAPRRRRTGPWCGRFAAATALIVAVGLAPPYARAGAAGGDLAEVKRLYDEGRYAEAEAAGRALLEAVASESGLDGLPAADAMHEVATAMMRGGKFGEEEALDLARRALDIRSARLEPGDLDIGRSLDLLGDIYYLRSEHQIASGLYERALASLQMSPDASRTEIEGARMDLANVRADLGDLAGARRLYERSIPLLEAVSGVRAEQMVGAYSNFATILTEMGDFDAARTIFERGRGVAEARLGPTHPVLGIVLANYVLLLLEVGEDAEADPIVRRSLAIRESRLGPDHPRVADSLISLGRILTRAGRYDEARPLLERALSIQETRLGPDHHFVAMALSALGKLFVASGDDDRARAAFLRVLEIRGQRLGSEHPQYAAALANLAALDLSTGRAAAALDRAVGAAGIIRKLVGRTARELPERQALDYGVIQASGLDVILSSAMRRGSAGAPGGPARAWDAVVRSRALVLDEMAARHRTVLERSSGELAPLIESLATARKNLVSALARGPDPARPDEFPAGIEKARAAVDDADRALARRSAEFRGAQAGRNVGPDDVSRALPAGAALVAFARHTRIGGRGSPDEAHYVAFVVPGPRRDPIIVPLGAARSIETLVADWRRSVSIAPADPAAAWAYRDAALALRRAIWDPVAAPLGRPKNVFIVPDGDLNLVNFATLPTTTDRFLLETGPTLHYLSAERDLTVDWSQHGDPGGVLVLGGPDFDHYPPAGGTAPIRVAGGPGIAADQGGEMPPSPAVYRGPAPACARSSGLRFEALPGSRDEAREVAALLSRAAGSERPEPVLVLTGRGADEESVKRLSPGRRVLHLATHGFWIGGLCDPAAGDGEGRPGANEAERSRSHGSPLLLSGLALAGVNRRNDPERSPEQDDGLLTADEIAALDLGGTEWVVLSACQTGVGPVVRGEGVLGLRRAFRVAGARTLIMSLWSIGDHDAREWVRELYSSRLEGLSTAEAMRSAARRIVESRREAGATTHPFTWGAFVAAGDWR